MKKGHICSYHKNPKGLYRRTGMTPESPPLDTGRRSWRLVWRSFRHWQCSFPRQYDRARTVWGEREQNSDVMSVTDNREVLRTGERDYRVALCRAVPGKHGIPSCYRARIRRRWSWDRGIPCFPGTARHSATRQSLSPVLNTSLMLVPAAIWPHSLREERTELWRNVRHWQSYCTISSLKQNCNDNNGQNCDYINVNEISCNSKASYTF